MDSATRGLLHDLVLKARPLLIGEARDLLEGVYGLRADGSFAPADMLPAVGTLEESRETRTRLETYLADEMAARVKGPEAVAKLVKEVAFTHLNRLVAFKMMESRRLVRGTLDRYQESNAFKFYLAEHPDEQARYDAGSLPQDALGEGPRDTAYRHFLLHQCAEMAEQIRVLFDPDTLPSRLFPRPPALAALIGWLNDPDLKDAWGEDETIGWVYQYFNEVEKDEVFARLNKGAKVRADEIPAATQLFTPHWVVRALVHNTLGRLWLAMHPDSHLCEDLDYLVPLAQEVPPEPLRLVREITLLDPACGTMHFGLVAFDLFAAMYREEIERAGQPGWPETPSVADEAEIPAAIVEHNLFGMDIDLRAVQLSALTLLLKARSLNREAHLTDHNLACADVLPLNGTRLDAFLKEMAFGHPLYERLIRGLWGRLKDSNQLGSLLRLEADLETLVADERRKVEQKGQVPLMLGFPADQFDTEEGRQEFWRIIEGQVIQAFDEFARRQAATGHDERYFAGEAIKGLRLLEMMGRRYDVVVANPPYMSSRTMSPAINAHLKRHYPESKNDLYAAFIERCVELSRSNGRIGMITQQSFMFLGRYREMRRKLLDEVAVEAMIHAGPHTFAEIGGQKVNTTIFTFRIEPIEQDREGSSGWYIRLVNEPSPNDKMQTFEQSIRRNDQETQRSHIYRCNQADFRLISGVPWIYWLPQGLRSLFRTLPPFANIAQPVVGCFTCDNYRFLRYWWEVGASRIRFACPDRASASASKEKWFPYMKGGSFQRWYGNQEYIINYFRDGLEVRQHRVDSDQSYSLPGQEYYFLPGITWSKVTSGTFAARLSPAGFLFDVAGSSAFPPAPHLLSVLGIMNSLPFRGLLSYVAPTINFESGQIASVPVPVDVGSALQSLVLDATALEQATSAEDETTRDFLSPPPWANGVQIIAHRGRRQDDLQQQIDDVACHVYGIATTDRLSLESQLRLHMDAGSGDDLAGMEEVGAVDAANGMQENVAPPIQGHASEALSSVAHQWVSYAMGVVLGRFAAGREGALGRGDFSAETGTALRALAYPEGLAVVEATYPDNLAARVLRALEVMLGEEDAGEAVMLAAGGKALADYLKGEFFKAHIQQYRKRPVYWLLQSPKKLYSVYVFHERMTPDTLHLLRGTAYLGGAVNGARGLQVDLHGALEGTPQGPARKRLERELEAAGAVLADLDAFDRNLAAVTSQPNERGEVVGWRPEIDDGVLLNMAPLHTLVPGWATEPRKAWESLARGEYDWAHTAMCYWPDRVHAACRTNKSFAIAHGLLALEGSSR